MPSHDRVAELGAVVDDLVIGIHREVGRRHGGALRTRFAALDLTSPGHLIDLAEFLIEGSCTPEVVRLRFRYGLAAAEQAVATLVDDGLLDRSLDPAPPLTELLTDVLSRRGDVASTMWPGALTDAVENTVSAVERAHGPLAEAHARLRLPERPAARLHHLLTTLRYTRMDAHAAAWSEHGLTAEEIVELTDAVAGGSASAPERRLRAVIEGATDRRCRPLLDAVDDPAGWIDTLRALAAA